MFSRITELHTDPSGLTVVFEIQTHTEKVRSDA